VNRSRISQSPGDPQVVTYVRVPGDDCRHPVRRLDGGMSHPVDDVELVLRVAPTDDEYRYDDDRWRSDFAELHDMVARAVPESAPQPVSDDSLKGIEIGTLIVSLGSAGAFTAAVEAFKAWLAKKPDRRRLDMQWRLGPDGGRITVDANNIDSSDVVAAANERLKAPG
jgi:hypothetical protein